MAGPLFGGLQLPQQEHPRVAMAKQRWCEYHYARVGPWNPGTRFQLPRRHMDMDRLPVDDGTPMHYPAAENYLLPQGIGPGDRPTMGDEPQGATIKAVDY